MLRYKQILTGTTVRTLIKHFTSNMPKIQKLRPLIRRQLPPRRIPHEVVVKQLRRKIDFGPVGEWLRAIRFQDDDSDSPLSQNEVRCTVTVQVTEPVSQVTSGSAISSYLIADPSDHSERRLFRRFASLRTLSDHHRTIEHQ